jgi:hypothetical protein
MLSDECETKEPTYPEGSFSCYLCQKTFGYGTKLGNNVVDLHFQAHVARFFATLFTNEQIRGAFYEFCKREYNLSRFIALP